MDNMARATRERGIHMQYCMEMPYHFLQGSRYGNLTSVRVAGDRFERNKWEHALYTAQMAASLGEWPWVDTFDSVELPNMILATLTAGPVGVGDAIEKIDAKNIAMACRSDGVIVKPDSAIVPLDQTYLSDAGAKKSPMTAAAYTDHGSHRTAYVFSFPRSAEQKSIEFRPADLGFTSDVWVYEPATLKGTLVPMNGTFTAAFAEANFKKAWSYFVAAPGHPTGYCNRWRQRQNRLDGRQRISQLDTADDHLTVTLAFGVDEKFVTLHAFPAISDHHCRARQN